MEEKIWELQKKINDISVKYLMGVDRDNIKRMRKVVPQIQEFALWFLEENRFEIEQALYQGMCENLLQILGDITESLHQEDRVLLHDAIAYGLAEYLDMFMLQREGASDDSL